MGVNGVERRRAIDSAGVLNLRLVERLHRLMSSAKMYVVSGSSETAVTDGNIRAPSLSRAASHPHHRENCALAPLPFFAVWERGSRRREPLDLGFVGRRLFRRVVHRQQLRSPFRPYHTD